MLAFAYEWINQIDENQHEKHDNKCMSLHQGLKEISRCSKVEFLGCSFCIDRYGGKGGNAIDMSGTLNTHK